MSLTLAKPLRTQLENAVKAARDVAEKAAKAALAQLATGDAKVPDYLSPDQKALRRRLRAHGRALGDVKHKDETQGLQHLVWEVAYEHWHRMLFARFLAENHLLLWQPGAPVTLAECDEIAQDPAMDSVDKLGAKSGWALAAKLAARMLPQVFKPASPVFELSFAPEHQREMERLLAALPEDLFKASDSLGWVYQFWQARRKDEVNASEVKIGADELPAVTQLFTEPYMVDFLLHNSLGAWWVTRHPGTPCPVPLTYLRTVPAPSPAGAGEGCGEAGEVPAAGKFEGWPDRLEDFKLLDPCCGSGHFLVAAFLMLVPMRMAAEGLSGMDAVDAVLADNLHGLEIDPRCVEIAVFALALAAWRFPDEDGNPLGVRADMPAPNVACCGLKVAASPKDWEALVPDTQANAALLRQELRLLHASFAQAPLLGSLLDPAKSLKDDLATSSFATLKDLLERALASEMPATLWGEGHALNDDAWDLAITARGLLDAARLLDGRYHLVATNVPYLARGKQSDGLRTYCDENFRLGRHDLAVAFIERCHQLCLDSGLLCIVSPQNWWFLTSYTRFRAWILQNASLRLIAALGEEAWEAFGNRGPLATLLVATRRPEAVLAEEFVGLDTRSLESIEEKKTFLLSGRLTRLRQEHQLKNPDCRIVLGEHANETLLEAYAIGLAGILNGDSPRFQRVFWEFPQRGWRWVFQQGGFDGSSTFCGMEKVIDFDEENGHLRELKEVRRDRLHDSDQRGNKAWGAHGVAVSQMRHLPVGRYVGNKFDSNVAVILPKKIEYLPAIWAYCSSSEYVEAVRRIDQKVNVTNATLVKVPFDYERWSAMAAREYPDGLPKSSSDDPTQWLFHGHPQPATDPLLVAVARLLGYRWPAETDTAMELSDEARTWISRCGALESNADDDGIVCLPSVRGEQPFHDRLLTLLIAAWESAQPGSWKASTLDKLLAEADCAGKGLDVWLRDKFFEQHAKLFHHRPFIWHVWDGLKDGFGALVNYHKLDAKNLDRLIHTYLGDWIRNQEAGVAKGTDGAPLRLSAAIDLKRRLELIQQGEFDGKAGYDIFVRWKPIAQQPIGWNPDLNDGVRMNIRPFLTAEVLRHNRRPKLNITWDKDRGKDVESAPWFKVFKGERINDHHLTLAEKIAAASNLGKGD